MDGEKGEEKSDEGDKGGVETVYPPFFTIFTTLAALIISL